VNCHRCCVHRSVTTNEHLVYVEGSEQCFWDVIANRKPTFLVWSGPVWFRSLLLLLCMLLMVCLGFPTHVAYLDVLQR
jgi:hypothetical protein